MYRNEQIAKKFAEWGVIINTEQVHDIIHTMALDRDLMIAVEDAVSAETREIQSIVDS